VKRIPFTYKLKSKLFEIFLGSRVKNVVKGINNISSKIFPRKEIK